MWQTRCLPVTVTVTKPVITSNCQKVRALPLRPSPQDPSHVSVFSPGSLKPDHSRAYTTAGRHKYVWWQYVLKQTLS